LFVSRVCLAGLSAGLSTGCAAWQRAACQFTGLSVQQLGNRRLAWTSFILCWGDASCDQVMWLASCDRYCVIHLVTRLCDHVMWLASCDKVMRPAYKARPCSGDSMV